MNEAVRRFIAGPVREALRDPEFMRETAAILRVGIDRQDPLEEVLGVLVMSVLSRVLEKADAPEAASPKPGKISWPNLSGPATVTEADGAVRETANPIADAVSAAQLNTKREDAEAALQQFREHLCRNGMLIRLSVLLSDASDRTRQRQDHGLPQAALELSLAIARFWIDKTLCEEAIEHQSARN